MTDATTPPPLAEVERRYILEVLRLVDHNRTAAAKILGITAKTVHNKLRAWKAAGLPVS